MNLAIAKAVTIPVPANVTTPKGISDFYSSQFRMFLGIYFADQCRKCGYDLSTLGNPVPSYKITGSFLLGTEDLTIASDFDDQINATCP
jgi:hypothetical protein